MAELKPCPFCGREPYTRVNVNSWRSGSAEMTFQVKCECGICKTTVLEICGADFNEIINAIQSVEYKWNCRSMEQQGE